MLKQLLNKDIHEKKSRSSTHRWISWLLALLIVAVISTQKTDNTGSDPRGTLLVSESIVQNGTIQLDLYGEELLNSYGYVIHKKNGHFYNYFPLGTALVSTPFIAISNILGFEMAKDEAQIQMILTTLVSLLIILILYKTARLYLNKTESILMAGLCWFGSSLASTVGTALWSHDVAFVFSSTAIFLVLRHTNQKALSAPVMVGLSLFLAYLCRPTLALLSPFLLLYYFIFDKKSATIAAVSLGTLLLGFMGWSQHEFSQVLPDYYLPKRLDGGDFQTAVYGNLLSPARGLLVFSPFILVSFVLSMWLAPRNKSLATLGLISIAWPIVHLLSISQFPHWWAGWSFGARLMVDAIPGLFVGLFSSMGTLRESRRFAYLPLMISGVLAIGINTYQGLFNPYGMRWNVEPNVDQHPEYLFDWQYPQFLHTKSRHESRLAEFLSQQLPPFKGAINIPYDSIQASFHGFYGIEAGFRWSEGQEAHLSFVLEKKDLTGEVNLVAGFLDNQRLIIFLNGTQVYEGSLNGGERELRFNAPPELLKTGLNSFTFYLPDAHKPTGNDPRILAMAFHRLTLK